MSLDFSPAGVAAPRAIRIRNHAAIEASLTIRNGEQLLLALVIPIGLLIGGRLLGGRMGVDPVAFPASVLALGLWSTSFTSVAIATGFERRYGVLERLAATPLTRGDLIAGKASATAALALGQAMVLAFVAWVTGWRPALAPGPTLLALLGSTLALVTFASWALALAGRLRAEATLALANLVYLAGAVSGIVLPVSSYPPPVAAVLQFLPTSALGELLRAAAAGTIAPLALPVLVLWAGPSLLLARKAFQWTS